MKTPRISTALFFTCAIFCAHPDRGYAEVVYEAIHDFAVKTYPSRMAHPYEVVIPNTKFGRLIICRIYDGDEAAVFSPDDYHKTLSQNRNGTTLSTQITNTANGETRLYFAHKTQNATFRCFYMSAQ